MDKPEGQNLTFSLVLEPRFLPVGKQFLLSEAVALALTDTFAQAGIETRIKWTNDIYAGNRKLVGILIEHSYSGPTLARTVVGIGINVNQKEFDRRFRIPCRWLSPQAARSTAARCSKPSANGSKPATHSSKGAMPKPCSATTANACTGWANSARSATPTARLSRPVIEGVRPSGELLLRHVGGPLREYLFKEVEFVVK